MARAGDVRVGFIADSSEFNRHARRNLTTLQRMEREVGKIGRAMREGFGRGVIAMGALSVAVGVGIRRMVDYSSTLIEASRNAGIATSSLENLRALFQGDGLGIVQTDKALAAFNKRLGEAAIGRGQAATWFDELGISIVDVQGNLRSVEDVLFDTFEALRDLDNSQTRAAASAAFFSDVGKRMSGTIGEVRGGFREASTEAGRYRTVSERLHAANKDLGQGFTDLKDNLDDLIQRVLANYSKELLVLINRTNDWIVRLKEASTLSKTISDFASSLQDSVGTVFGALTGGLAGASAGRVAGSSLGSLWDKQRRDEEEKSGKKAKMPRGILSFLKRGFGMGAGHIVGSILGGPIGAVIGASIGLVAGPIIGDILVAALEALFKRVAGFFGFDFDDGIKVPAGLSLAEAEEYKSLVKEKQTFDAPEDRMKPALERLKQHKAELENAVPGTAMYEGIQKLIQQDENVLAAMRSRGMYDRRLEITERLRELESKTIPDYLSGLDFTLEDLFTAVEEQSNEAVESAVQKMIRESAAFLDRIPLLPWGKHDAKEMDAWLAKFRQTGDGIVTRHVGVSPFPIPGQYRDLINARTQGMRPEERLAYYRDSATSIFASDKDPLTLEPWKPVDKLAESLAKMRPVLNEMRGSFETLGNSIFDSFETAGESVRNFARDLLRIGWQRMVMSPLSDKLFGAVDGSTAGLLGGWFSGFFANGGLAHRGLAVVGERGPELVDFSTPGRVYPNESLRAMASGGGGMTFNLNVNSTDGPGVRAAWAEIQPQFITMAKAAVAENARRPGAYRQSIRGRY